MEAEHSKNIDESNELSALYDEEIAHLEQANEELRVVVKKYKEKNDDLKEENRRTQLKTSQNLDSIQRELQFVRSQQEYYKSRTRELEQDNDDLERSERVAKSSLQTMETKLSHAMEHNSKLQGEVETKKVLVDEVQRLKDELRDLNLELNVVRSRNSRVVPQNLSKSSANVGGEGDRQTKVVQDIMSRVKELESRLQGARGKVEPLIGASGQYATLHSRIARSRSIANPKVSTVFAKDPARSRLPPVPPTSISNGLRKPVGGSMIPGVDKRGSVKESRLERMRLMREQTDREQQAVPQRRPMQ